MRKPFLWAIALLLSFGLSGCLFSAFLAGESRLQLENGSRMAIAELEAVGPGDTVLLVGDTLWPGERSRTRDVGLDGIFRLRLLAGDTACFRAGCAQAIDLGEQELGGSVRFRFAVDRDGPWLEKR